MVGIHPQLIDGAAQNDRESAARLRAIITLAENLGIVPIEKLREFRGYFIVLAFIIAAVVTPPDVISQLALAIPMCILYELGIVAASLMARNKPAEPEGD